VDIPLPEVVMRIARRGDRSMLLLAALMSPLNAYAASNGGCCCRCHGHRFCCIGMLLLRMLALRGDTSSSPRL